MISYSAEFPVNEKSSIKDILYLACTWIAGSPHTKLKRESIFNIINDEEGIISLQGETIYTGFASIDNLEIGGLRYVKLEENGIEWTTTVVASQTPSQHFVSIQVNCESMVALDELPTSKKPHIIKQIFDKIGGGMDGDIPVSDRAIILDEGDETIAADLIMGRAGNLLPVVYVSSDFDGSYTIDYDRLARRLSGSAHVIIEPSISFSVKLKKLTDSYNVYGGTVGVYWPIVGIRKSYYRRRIEGPSNVAYLVEKSIREAMANKRLKTYCTWLHLKECISKNKFNRLKMSGSTEIEKFIEYFDSEMSVKQDKLDEAESEIARLQMEIHRISSTKNHEENGIFNSGREEDLYPEEIRSLILDSLNTHLSYTVEGSRRRHVLEDFLDQNQLELNFDDIKDQVKNIFKSYVDMDQKTRSALAGMGFSISEDGKHHKIVFHGDGRYTFSMSKTSSDHRAGRNFASDINKKLF